LKEAYDEYNLAIEGFEKLNKKIQIQNNHLSKFRNSSSEEYKTWETNTRITVYTAINSSSIGVFATGVFDTADAFECLGICSTLGNLIVLGATEATVESKIFKYMAELRKFEKLTGNMLVKGNQIENTLRKVNAFLNSEIELIVEQVSENIDSDPEEVLRKYAEIRTIFNEGLDDLQKTAQEFLNRGEIFVQKEDNDNDNDKDDDDDDDDVDNNDDDDDDERILLQGNDDDDIAADDDDDETLSIFVDA